MALYDCSEGLVYKIWNPEIGGIVSYDVEFVRNKVYELGDHHFYWIKDDKLYCKLYNNISMILQNDNLVGVREFSVTVDKVVTITHNYTIGVFTIYGKNIGKFEEYGLPNLNLKITTLYNYRPIKPDEVFTFGDFDHKFSEYNGQNMLIHMNMCISIFGSRDGEYNQYNEYVNARYKTKNMIDRNDELILYSKNGKLFMKDYNGSKKYEVPDDATLYNPNHVNMKSARSI